MCLDRIETDDLHDAGNAIPSYPGWPLRCLPLLLLEVMHCLATGVMVARGDLAMECGFERLVEVQEEILWMCEAAHVPVIWATQVLERLAKSGLPTRVEVTDAGMGSRAECVMLHKGENIVEAVQSLADILHRMQTDQAKKRPIFRRLHLAEHLLNKKTCCGIGLECASVAKNIKVDLSNGNEAGSGPEFAASPYSNR
ncbi:Pyruvate kinase [Planctomycetes bacterium CA13]|uniref:Pyruvate kinase n=1 Tax=Novipirellula herctigrandis TaxID=2527986 RepID=A0A5C5Z2L9_9BACT|nr:Pyruvate kinase [Planctomycetes bacterium CA13]